MTSAGPGITIDSNGDSNVPSTPVNPPVISPAGVLDAGKKWLEQMNSWPGHSHDASSGGSPHSPLRIKVDPKRENELTARFISEEYRVKDIQYNKVSTHPVIALVTAVPIEAVAIADLMKMEGDFHYVTDVPGKWPYFIGKLGGVDVLLTKIGPGSGRQWGSQQAGEALMRLWPCLKAILAVGIAWGHEDIPLGTVLFTSKVLSVDQRRVQAEEDTHLGEPYHAPLPPEITRVIEHASRRFSFTSADGTVTSAQLGPVASSDNLIDSRDHVNRILSMTSKIESTVIGGEMELTGLISTAGSVPVIGIKAVVDKAGVGERKEKRNQPYGAAAAAAATKMVLEAAKVPLESIPVPKPSELVDDQGSAPSHPLPAPNFVGRENKLATLKDFVDGKEQVMVICGDAGMGKTALVSQFLKETTSKTIAIFCNGPNQIRVDLARQVWDWMEGCGLKPDRRLSKAALLLTDDLDSAIKAIFNYLKEVSAADMDDPLILVVDALDEIDLDDSRKVAEKIAGALKEAVTGMPSWCKVIMTVRGELELPGVNPMVLKESDLTDYIRSYLHNEISEDQVERALHMSQGSFLRAKLIAAGIKTNPRYLDQWMAQPTSLNDLYSSLYNRSRAQAATRVDLFNIVVAGESVSGKTFKESLSIAKLSWEDVSEELDWLVRNRFLRGTPEKGYALAHATVREWILEGAATINDGVRVDLAKGHWILAKAYFRNKTASELVLLVNHAAKGHDDKNLWTRMLSFLRDHDEFWIQRWLQLTAKHNNVAALEFLLDKGVRAPHWMVPLGYMTAIPEREDVWMVLYKKGMINVDEEWNGCTMLMRAAAEGSVAIVKKLTASGANIWARKRSGWTARDCALNGPHGRPEHRSKERNEICCHLFSLMYPQH